MLNIFGLTKIKLCEKIDAQLSITDAWINGLVQIHRSQFKVAESQK